MKIIKIQGGLGNQMFQYAFGMSMQSENVLYDCEEIETQGNCHNGIELEKIFSLKIRHATEEDVKYLLKKDSVLWRRMLNKIYWKKQRVWICENPRCFHPELYTKRNAYFEGYWQSEKYFWNIREKIRYLYQFPELKGYRNIELSKKIKKSNSVAVHIRRGDYVSLKENDFLAGICTVDYYQKAIQLIQLKTKSPTFFFFSDDIEWVKKNLKVKNGEYVYWNRGSDSFVDMQLMNMCKHNIIANSTFSWWAAWLNSNNEKIVVAPEKWDKIGSKDIQCEDWILI